LGQSAGLGFGGCLRGLGVGQKGGPGRICRLATSWNPAQDDEDSDGQSPGTPDISPFPTKP
jgi:hypothetical protein